MGKNLRVHAIIRGKVQGVCFRLETKRAAESIGVNGWVRNLADGSVEALFEGEEENIRQILAWCRRGPTLSRVTSVDKTEETFKGEFGDFRIKM